MEYLTTSRIERYEIAEGDTTFELSSDVESYMENGYEPFGSPFFANGYFYQAMVRYEEER